MPKLYILLVLISIVANSNAQQLNKDQFIPFPPQLANEKFIITPAQPINKTPGAELWRDDFDSINNWTINNAGELTSGWFITDNSTGTQGWSLFVGNGMNSTSGGNYAEMFNGDPATSLPPVANSILTLTSDTINLTTIEVDLVFEQEGALYEDMQEIYLTIDSGATWVLVDDNLDMGVLTTTSGLPYSEPHIKKTDLKSALTAAGFSSPGNLQIRFQWAPGLQNISYGWLIDDVRIVEKLGSDLAISEDSWFHNTTSKIRYTKVPQSQWAPMTFTGTIDNLGQFDQPNTTLSVSVSGAGAGTVSNTPYLATAGSQNINETNTFTPTSAGTFNAVYNLYSDSVEVDLTNNNASTTWEGTWAIYAKDLDYFTGWLGPFDDDLDGIDDPYEIISEFEFNNSTILYCIDVVFHAGNGEEIYYNIYHADSSGNFVPEYDGLTAPVPTYNITASDISTISGSENWVRLPLQSIDIDPAISNSYFAVVGYNLINDPANAVKFATSGSTEDTTNFMSVFATTAGQTDYFIHDIPMIRLTTDYCGGLTSKNLNLSLDQNQPNPFSSRTIIPFGIINSASIEFTVTDLMGKIIERQELGTLPSGDHTIDFKAGNIADGMYFYTIYEDGKGMTKSMYRVTNSFK
jgi:hypothetical protein